MMFNLITPDSERTMYFPWNCWKNKQNDIDIDELKKRNYSFKGYLWDGDILKKLLKKLLKIQKKQLCRFLINFV